MGKKPKCQPAFLYSGTIIFQNEVKYKCYQIFFTKRPSEKMSNTSELQEILKKIIQP